MHKPIINNVCISGAGDRESNRCYRIGTAFTTLKEFGRRFGDPHTQDFSEDGIDGAGKVHAMWYIDTPRGQADVSDYWWNAKDELSIHANSRKMALWVISWLKLHGVKSKIRMLI